MGVLERYRGGVNAGAMAAHVWALRLVHEVVIKFCDIILYKVVLATSAFLRCFTVLVHRTLQERRVCMFTPGGGVRKVTARARLAWRGRFGIARTLSGGKS